MWTAKYRPKSLREFVNQKEALEAFLEWIKKWKQGKGLLFHGPPGTGKTCLVEAYAKENNLEFIEMNASDFRSKKQIEDIIGQAMKQSPLLKKSKIFLLDEIDSLVAREDVGGTSAIVKIIKESRFPVILTANNPYDPKLQVLRQYCQLVQFKKIPVFDVEKRLRQICENEKINYDKEILRELAKHSEGDLRSAINDLEIICQGKNKITVDDIEVLGYRERETSIFDALKMIFKTKTALAAKLSINNVDKDPEEIFWWIENNIANEYEKPEEIAKAFDALSKADLFGQRIRSRQYWRFREYMIDLMTAGVATAKKEMYRKFIRYEYPSNLIVLGRSKMERKEEKEMLLRLSEKLHCSTRKVREFLPFFTIMMRNKEFKRQFTEDLSKLLP